MRVKKKNSFASFLLTVIIIAIVSVALIITLMDEESKKAYDEVEVSVTGSYLSLESALKALQNNLNKLLNGIGKLEGVDVESSDWEGASAALKSKMEEIDTFEKEYFASFENKQKGLDYTDYFNYSVNGVPVTVQFTELKDAAKLDLSRATSVEQMDKIIEQYKKDVQSFDTNLERLYSILDTIDKGVKPENYSIYLTALDVFNSIDYNIFAHNVENEIYERDTLLERIELLLVDYVGLVTDYYIELVKAIPVGQLIVDEDETVAIISIECKDAIVSAEIMRDELCEFCNEYGLDVLEAYNEKTSAKKYQKQDQLLVEYRIRLDQLLAAKAAAESINETIANYDKAAMMPNSNTLAELQDIEAAIKEWSANSKHQIVTDELHVKNKCTEQLHKGDKAVCEYCGYVAANYNLVNHSAFDGLMSEYAKLTSNGLSKVVSAIIDALNDIYENNDTVYYTVNVTLNDEDAINDLIEAYQKLWSDSNVTKAGLSSALPSSKEKGTDLLYNTKYDAALAEIDYVLCLEEDGETDGIDTLSGAIAQLRQAKTDYDYIVAEVAKFNTFVTDTVMEKDADGKPTKNYSVAYILGHQDDLLEMDKLLYNLIVDYDLDSFVDVIEEKTDDGKKLTDPEKDLAAALEIYMEIRLVPDYVNLVEKIEEGVASHKGKATQSLAEDKGEELKARAQQLLVEDYEFAPEVEIVDGLSQYVGVGFWSDKTNKTKLEMKAILDNLDESFTIDNPIVSN